MSEQIQNKNGECEELSSTALLGTNAETMIREIKKHLKNGATAEATDPSKAFLCMGKDGFINSGLTFTYPSA